MLFLSSLSKFQNITIEISKFIKLESHMEPRFIIPYGDQHM